MPLVTVVYWPLLPMLFLPSQQYSLSEILSNCNVQVIKSVPDWVVLAATAGTELKHKHFWCHRTAASMSAGASHRLKFCADFEGGSLGLVTSAEDGSEHDIMVREDACGPQHRWWFHFQMQGGMQGKSTPFS